MREGPGPLLVYLGEDGPVCSSGSPRRYVRQEFFACSYDFLNRSSLRERSPAAQRAKARGLEGDASPAMSEIINY